MTSEDNIKKQIKNTKIKTNPEVNQSVLEGLFNRMDHAERENINLCSQHRWRKIMKNRLTKVALAMVLTVTVLIGVNIYTGSQAWAIDQTVKAFDNIRTLEISGTDYWKNEPVPFNFWARFPENKKDSLELRFESTKQLLIVQGNKAWSYWKEENVARVYDNITTSDGMMRDLTFWYKISEINPWITGKVLATLKLFTDDWREEYGKCEKTGRNCVFVTCSYEPLGSSFWFVCDIDDKHIVEGKYWRNSNRQGEPVCHAAGFKYNQEIDDSIFDFKIPEGVNVVNSKDEKEADTLFDHGEKLFKEQRFKEAVKVYLNIYNKYPNINKAEIALMMAGICYQRSGQTEKAIATFEKAVKEYDYLKGWTYATYYYLGDAYAKNNQKDQAVKALKNCIIIGESIGADSEKFPLMDARRYLSKLNGTK